MDGHVFQKDKVLTYTQKEIESNVSTLTAEQDDLLLQRKELNRRLRELKKQIAYWKDLDLSQTRIC